MKAFWDIVDHTLSSLDMEGSERENYQKIGFQRSYVGLAFDKQLDEECHIGAIIQPILNGDDMSISHKTICLRNTIFSLTDYLELLIVYSRFNFEIFDNLGTSIHPALNRWDRKGDLDIEKRKHDFCYENLSNAYFIDFLNNKEDPYLKVKIYIGDSIYELMKRSDYKLYYSTNSLSQLKNISIRPAH